MIYKGSVSIIFKPEAVKSPEVWRFSLWSVYKTSNSHNYLDKCTKLWQAFARHFAQATD